MLLAILTAGFGAAIGCAGPVEALDSEPCTGVEVVPSVLNFGAVQRTRSLRRSFELRNSQPVDCELEVRWRCQDGSRGRPANFPDRVLVPSESAETITTEWVAGEELAGTCPNRCAGAIEFQSNGQVVADLTWTGTIGDSTLLVVPTELNVSVPVGCSRKRAVTLYATGRATTWTEVSGPRPARLGFEIEPLALPLTLQAGHSHTLALADRPRRPSIRFALNRDATERRGAARNHDL